MKEFFAALGLGWGTLLIVWWMRYGPIGPWLHSLWTARRSAGETAGVPEDFDTQPRTSEREPHDPPEENPGLLPPGRRTQLCGCPIGEVLPTCPCGPGEVAEMQHEVLDDEESNDTAADFVLWANEIEEQVRKYVRRMGRWSQ